MNTCASKISIAEKSQLIRNKSINWECNWNVNSNIFKRLKIGKYNTSKNWTQCTRKTLNFFRKIKNTKNLSTTSSPTTKLSNSKSKDGKAIEKLTHPNSIPSTNSKKISTFKSHKKTALSKISNSKSDKIKKDSMNTNLKLKTCLQPSPIKKGKTNNWQVKSEITSNIFSKHKILYRNFSINFMKQTNWIWLWNKKFSNSKKKKKFSYKEFITWVEIKLTVLMKRATMKIMMTTLTSTFILATQKDSPKTKALNSKISSVQPIKDSCFRFNLSWDSLKVFSKRKHKTGKLVCNISKRSSTQWNALRKVYDLWWVFSIFLRLNKFEISK